MATQLALFASTIPSTSPIGLTVIMPDCPACGAVESIIGAGKGPHCGSLHCAVCGKHRGWIRPHLFFFIETIIDNFGRPVDPIVIRGAASC